MFGRKSKSGTDKFIIEQGRVAGNLKAPEPRKKAAPAKFMPKKGK